jgi:hypothetical protein
MGARNLLVYIRKERDRWEGGGRRRKVAAASGCFCFCLIRARRWCGSGTPRFRWLWLWLWRPGRDHGTWRLEHGHGRFRRLLVGGRRCAVRWLTQLLSPTEDEQSKRGAGRARRAVVAISELCEIEGGLMDKIRSSLVLGTKD